MGLIARAVRRAIPERWQPPARYYYERARGLLERELPLAVAMLEAGDRAIDVGANVGVYTYAFARAGATVEAFEPQRDCALVLNQFAARSSGVRVHQVALGAAAERAELHIPLEDGRSRRGEASLTSSGPGSTEVVEIRPLDSFDFSGVALIKIDVEGSEASVIEGARETIARHRPLLLVEIEQRHHSGPVAEVFRRIEGLDYEGFFLDGTSRIRPLRDFDLDRDQRRSQPRGISRGRPYINNFLFQATDRTSVRRWVIPW
jgi:FkbM family methyltransferase